MAPASSQSLPNGPLLILVICWLTMFVTLILPPVPLDQNLAVYLVGVADSGSKWIVPLIVAFVVLLLVTRPGMGVRQRLRETLLICLVLGGLLGGGAYLNEFIVKPILGVERPNAMSLDEDGTLGTSLESFYNMSSKAERSEYLKEVLENPYFTGVKLAPQVRNHWIQESGHSLPSGHTLGAFTLLTFALVATKVMTSKVRFGLACVLIPWAIAVAYSRVLLHVHWPKDVIVSAMAGILLGIGCYALLRRLLWSRPVQVAEPSDPAAEAESIL